MANEEQTWSQIADKWNSLTEDLEALAAIEAGKSALMKLFDIDLSSGTPGPSPGEPSGAPSSQTTPPASDESAATPVQGRWKDTAGKWEQYAGSADAEVEQREGVPFDVELLSNDDKLDEILKAILELTEDMRAVMGMLGVSTSSPGGAKEPGERKPKGRAKPKDTPTKKAFRNMGAEVIRAAASFGF